MNNFHAANAFNDPTGDDEFWLKFGLNCQTAGDLVGTSDAGLGTDECGDSGAGFAIYPWAGCNAPINIEPPQCP